MNSYTDFQNDHEVVPGLRREWMVLVRRRWMIAGILVTAVATTVLFNSSVRPLYSAAAIAAANETIANQPYVRPNTDATRMRAVIEKEIATITSRELAMQMVGSLSPAEKAELSTGVIGPWYRRLQFMPAATIERAPSKAQLVTALRSRMRVRWREPSSWIDIGVDGYDGAAVADLANHLARLYVDQTADANRRYLADARSSVDTQLQTKEKQLGEQLSDLRAVGEETGVGDVAVRKANLERQVRALQDALAAAQTARIGRAATGREAAQADGGVVASASDARLQAAQARVSELEEKERALLATLGPQHPEVVTIHEQLAASRTRVEALTASAQQVANSTYDLAVKEEQRIEASLARVQRDLSALDKGSVAYNLDQKRADASRLAMEQMIQRQELTAPIVIETEIIQTAFPPSLPSTPRKRENLLYSLVVGLIGGVFLAWLLERFDDSVQTPDDIKVALGLPFLGVVPLIPKLRETSLLAAVADGPTGFADGLRVVRTNLMFGVGPVKPRVIVFTSASPGDGKSTVAAGVSLLLQETGATVLLIDGDLRRPSVHKLFEIESETGLSELLGQDERVRLDDVSNLLPGLDVLVAGEAISVSAALLGSERMRALITQARKAYDWVIIDSPPSLGLPDASVLATLADAVVVVCSGDKTPRQALHTVTEQLKGVGATLFGVVLNRVNMNRHSYYYGRHYSKYYGSATKDPKPAIKKRAASRAQIDEVPAAAPTASVATATTAENPSDAVDAATVATAVAAPSPPRRTRKKKS